MGYASWAFIIIGALLGATYVILSVLARHTESLRALFGLKGEESASLSNARYIRKSGRVVAPVTFDAGQVEVGGELWEARAAHPLDRFEPDMHVLVVNVRETFLVVVEDRIGSKT